MIDIMLLYVFYLHTFIVERHLLFPHVRMKMCKNDEINVFFNLRKLCLIHSNKLE